MELKKVRNDSFREPLNQITNKYLPKLDIPLCNSKKNISTISLENDNNMNSYISANRNEYIYKKKTPNQKTSICLNKTAKIYDNFNKNENKENKEKRNLSHCTSTEGIRNNISTKLKKRLNCLRNNKNLQNKENITLNINDDLINKNNILKKEYTYILEMKQDQNKINMQNPLKYYTDLSKKNKNSTRNLYSTSPINNNNENSITVNSKRHNNLSTYGYDNPKNQNYYTKNLIECNDIKRQIPKSNRNFISNNITIDTSYYDDKYKNSNKNPYRNYSNYSNIPIKSYKSFGNSLNYIKKIKSLPQTNEITNIEQLLIIEEKFQDILSAIKSGNNIQNICTEFLQIYYNFPLLEKFDYCFIQNKKIKKIVHLSVILMIYDIIILYHLSYNRKYLKTSYKFLHIIISLNNKTFLLICQYICSMLSSRVNDNIWIIKLKTLIENNLVHIELNNLDYINFLSNQQINFSDDIKSGLNNGIIDELNFHLYNLDKYIKVLLNNFPEDKFKNNFKEIYLNICESSGTKTISPLDLIKFFKEKIIRILNENASINGQVASKYRKKYDIISVPYIKEKGKKEFTLVLDLDETLINFSITNVEEGKGTIKFRPHIDLFLSSLKNYYEIICFTTATKDYADPIENEIDAKNKYFDYRLYREHTIIYEDNFVKDISRIGRPLDKTIIVDNIPQNYRLQKENGIWIKPFWGDEEDDMALYFLREILEKIALTFKDVRKGIAKYKDEILAKVSSNYEVMIGNKGK